MMLRTTFILVVGAVVALGTTAEAYVITAFDPGVYDADTAAMDAALGITGYTIEDFEDGALVPDLTLTGFGTLNFPDNNPGLAWDGTNLARFYGVTEANPGALNFNIVGGASSVGIGLSSVDCPFVGCPTNRLRVNGGPWIDIDDTTFPNLPAAVDQRHGYLRIDQEPGDAPITIVEIADPADETLMMDHVAFIPEPSTCVLSAIGLVGLGLVGWRRRR
jgi:hypothetical protein